MTMPMTAREGGIRSEASKMKKKALRIPSASWTSRKAKGLEKKMSWLAKVLNDRRPSLQPGGA